MNVIEPKATHRPPGEESTPDNRKDWAHAYAIQRAAEGKAATVREIQSAVKGHFGRGLGNQEATAIARQAIALTTNERKALDRMQIDSGSKTENAVINSGQNLKIITRLMKQAGIKTIELLEDGSFRVTTD